MDPRGHINETSESNVKRLSANVSNLFLWSTKFHIALLVIFWLLAVGGRLYTSGISYSFNYSVFQPDGVLYALRTYMFLGEDQLTAAKLIENWYFVHGGSKTHFDPASILPSNSPAWGLVAPRVLYPLLSVPFVAAIGMNGLLFIPSLSLLILVFVVYSLGKKRLQPTVALTVSLILLLSPTVLRWMVANITDSLFVALFALVCLCLESESNRKRTYLYITALIILTSLTRFATPIWLALAMVDFIHNRRGRAVFIGVVSLLATIPTYLTQPTNSVLPREGDLSLVEKLVALPISFLKILFIEVAQLAVLDRLLLLFLFTSMAFALIRFKDQSSLRFLMVLLATWAIGALNGSLGVNFRYQMPVIPFAAAVLIINANYLRDWLFRRISNVEVKKTK